jgi:F420-0:gamma-glutamyl ligase
MDWPEDQIRISIFFSLSASVRSDDPEAFSSERIRKHVVDVVNKAYGPYAQKALGFILRTDGVNKDVGDQAAILLPKDCDRSAGDAARCERLERSAEIISR